MSTLKLCTSNLSLWNRSGIPLQSRLFIHYLKEDGEEGEEKAQQTALHREA